VQRQVGRVGVARRDCSETWILAVWKETLGPTLVNGTRQCEVKPQFECILYFDRANLTYHEDLKGVLSMALKINNERGVKFHIFIYCATCLFSYTSASASMMVGRNLDSKTITIPQP
jgi:hypothetical protein